MTKETKGWTPERRAAQRERILAQKPWEKSTGPKTVKGKWRSSVNSRKHGSYSKEMRAIRKYISDNSRFLEEVNRIYSVTAQNELKNKLIKEQRKSKA